MFKLKRASVIKSNMVEYSELRKQYGSEYIPYPVLLEASEWHEKRKEIIERDDDKCTCCSEQGTFPHYDGNKWVYVAVWSEFKKGWVESVDENGRYELLEYEEEMSCSNISNAPTILQVHHRYYIKGRLPWDYKSDALQTLYVDCH
ncbi:MAG: hypothetical protein EOO58_02055 [Hymenobacter sp.]|nr:MAG: hypothetical protein EOO58_02055 [Hymenobacter sp.]